eukprot:UN27558
MQSPTYLQLDLLLPIDVYYATLTFIGERLADTTHTEVKVLPGPQESLPTVQQPVPKANKESTRVNLRKLVENECECGYCFDTLERSHTAPWHLLEDDEGVLWNVRDRDVIKESEICESLHSALRERYEESRDSNMGFITPTKHELQQKSLNDKLESQSE